MGAILFFVEGVVKRGDRVARELGFPTVNIACDPSLPGGIYAGRVDWRGRSYCAAIYREDGKGVVEAYLIDFNGELYGERLMLRAYEKIRDVQHFDSKEDLIAAIKRDVEHIKKICSRE